MTAPQLKYIVHYRESPDSPQWEEECLTKAEADAFALNIFLNGGISVTVTEELDDDIILGDTDEKQTPAD